MNKENGEIMHLWRMSREEEKRTFTFTLDEEGIIKGNKSGLLGRKKKIKLN